MVRSERMRDKGDESPLPEIPSPHENGMVTTVSFVPRTDTGVPR